MPKFSNFVERWILCTAPCLGAVHPHKITVWIKSICFWNHCWNLFHLPRFLLRWDHINVMGGPVPFLVPINLALIASATSFYWKIKGPKRGLSSFIKPFFDSQKIVAWYSPSKITKAKICKCCLVSNVSKIIVAELEFFRSPWENKFWEPWPPALKIKFSPKWAFI